MLTKNATSKSEQIGLLTRFINFVQLSLIVSMIHSHGYFVTVDIAHVLLPRLTIKDSEINGILDNRLF